MGTPLLLSVHCPQLRQGVTMNDMGPVKPPPRGRGTATTAQAGARGNKRRKVTTKPDSTAALHSAVRRHGNDTTVPQFLLVKLAVPNTLQPQDGLVCVSVECRHASSQGVPTLQSLYVSAAYLHDYPSDTHSDVLYHTSTFIWI